MGYNSSYNGIRTKILKFKTNRLIFKFLKFHQDTSFLQISSKKKKNHWSWILSMFFSSVIIYFNNNFINWHITSKPQNHQCEKKMSSNEWERNAKLGAHSHVSRNKLWQKHIFFFHFFFIHFFLLHSRSSWQYSKHEQLFYVLICLNLVVEIKTFPRAQKKS